MEAIFINQINVSFNVMNTFTIGKEKSQNFAVIFICNRFQLNTLFLFLPLLLKKLFEVRLMFCIFRALFQQNVY